MRIFFITTPPDKAEPIAEQLLNERLIACANIIPGVRSLYWWKGAIQKDGESLMIVKTRDDLAERLIQRVKEIHPYDVPEVIAVEVREGNAEYVAWVHGETDQSPPRQP